MIKTSIAALISATAVLGLAVPAFAESTAPRSIVSSATSSIDQDNVIAQLKDNGITATNVEEWSDLIRADVILSDGTRTWQYFTTHTLTPVSL